MATLLTPPVLYFTDNDGKPLSMGKIYTYQAGTLTKKATFQDAAQVTAHQNPVILDAFGRTVMYGGGSYRMMIKDKDDVIIRDVDNIPTFSSVTARSDALEYILSGNGSQTAFTLAQNLGTDEKAIFVFVDAGAGKGFDILPASSYTINGVTLTFTVAPATGTGNIIVRAPLSLVNAANAAAAAADISASEAADSAARAAASSAANLQGTSTTSVVIGTGSKVFTIQAGMAFTVGRFVLVSSAANPANYMHGQITAYSGTSLTVNVTNIGGSGTLNDWNITVSGTQGSQGPAGNITNIATQPVATITASDITIFADVSDSNNSKRTTVQGILDLVPAPVQVIEKVSTTTFNNDATFDVPLVAGYVYEIEFVNITPTAAFASLNIRTSSNNGVSYNAGATDYAFSIVRMDGTITDADSSGSAHIETQANTNASSPTAICGKVTVSGHESIVAEKIIGFCFNFNPSGSTPAYYCGTGVRKSTTAITNVRFFFASGNFTRGTAIVYRKAI